MLVFLILWIILNYFKRTYFYRDTRLFSPPYHFWVSVSVFLIKMLRNLSLSQNSEIEYPEQTGFPVILQYMIQL